MSAIPRKDRETLTEEEFLARVTYFGLEVRRAGTRWWVHSPDRKDRRTKGTPVHPNQLIEFIRSWTHEGEPILKIIASKTFPSWVGIAYTEAGRRFARSRRMWARASPRPPLYELMLEDELRWRL